MKISWLKTLSDKESFNVFDNLGFNVIKIENPEKVDEKIDELINQNYKTIILSNEIASFSGDLIKKYRNGDDVSIIIASGKNNERD